jgi:hypothetical protein
LATGPFEVVFRGVRRALLDRELLDAPFPPLRLRVLRVDDFVDDLDEPFLLVDRLGLEPLRVDRLLLEDLVFWAMFALLFGFLAGCAVRTDRAGQLPL